MKVSTFLGGPQSYHHDLWIYNDDPLVIDHQNTVILRDVRPPVVM